MTDFVNSLLHYGYALVFFFVFLEGLGLPLPTAPIVLAAGAVAAYGLMSFWWVVAVAVGAMMLGDSIMYLLGRKAGWYVLGLLCKLSLNPESCVIRSAETFYRRGRMTLLVSKFLPGINTMAPPLAGTLRMHVAQFLGLDLLASTIYILPFTAAGFFFSKELTYLTNRLIAVNKVAGWLLAAAVLLYLLYRVSVVWKDRKYLQVQRVSIDHLRQRMDGEAGAIIVADVRSHGYHEPGTTRIKNSIRIDPEVLASGEVGLPRDKEIYLYCT